MTAKFNADSTLVLTPDLVGPTGTRKSTQLFHLTKRLLYTKRRDGGEAPKLHLFGQLKRITHEWLENHLVCKGGTYPAQLVYQELADMASWWRRNRE